MELNSFETIFVMVPLVVAHVRSFVTRMFSTQFTVGGVRQKSSRTLAFFQKFRSGSVRVRKYTRTNVEMVEKVVEPQNSAPVELDGVNQANEPMSVVDTLISAAAVLIGIPLSTACTISSMMVNISMLLWEFLTDKTSIKIKIALGSAIISFVSMLFQLFDYEPTENEISDVKTQFSELLTDEKVDELDGIVAFQEMCLKARYAPDKIQKLYSSFKVRKNVPYCLPSVNEAQLVVDSKFWTKEFIIFYLGLTENLYNILKANPQPAPENTFTWEGAEEYSGEDPPIDLQTQMDQFQIVTVPSDGNCMFWSMLASDAKELTMTNLKTLKDSFNALSLTKEEMQIVNTYGAWGTSDMLFKWCTHYRRSLYLAQMNKEGIGHTVYFDGGMRKTGPPLKIIYYPIQEHFNAFVEKKGNVPNKGEQWYNGANIDPVVTDWAEAANKQDEQLPVEGVNQSDSMKDKFTDLAVEIFDKIFGLLFGIIYIKTTKTNAPLRDLATSFSLGKLLKEGAVDTKAAVEKIFLEKDPEKQFIAQCEAISKKLHLYMEIPPYKMANSATLYNEWKNYQREVETFRLNAPKEYANTVRSLSSLIDASSNLITQIACMQHKSLPRQEPVAVLFTGTGGIGKTQALMNLAYKVKEKLYPGMTYHEAIGTYPPSQKYWPTLHGEPIGIYDEVASCTTFADEPLLRDIKSIVSAVHFNCEGAALSQKQNPMQQHLICMSSNQTLEGLQKMASDQFDKSSVPSFWRRIQTYECARPDNLPPFDPNNPQPGDFRKDYSHIYFNKHIFDVKTGTTKFLQRLTMDEVIADTVSRIQTKKNRHQVEMDKLLSETAISGVNQSDSADHFVVNINGRAAAGKSRLLEAAVSDFVKVLNYQVVRYCDLEKMAGGKRLKKRVILIVDDDIFLNSPEIEQKYMHCYNNILANGSVIFVATNISPGYSRVPVIGTNGYKIIRTSPFINEGMVRRMGYIGSFVDTGSSKHGIEFIAHEELYHIPKDQVIQFPDFNPKHEITFGNLMNLNTTNQTFLDMCKGAAKFATFTAKQAIMGPGTQLAAGYSPALAFNMASYTRADAKDMIYKQYMKWLDSRKDYLVVYEPVPTVNWNFKIFANRACDVRLSHNYLEMINNIFYDPVKFDKCDAPWKLFITREVFDACMKDKSKFSINVSNFTEDVILNVVRKYVDGLTALGIEPKLLADIGDQGVYAFVNGKLHVQKERVVNRYCTFSIKDDEVWFEMPNRVIMCKWNSILGYHNGEHSIPIEHNLNLQETEIFVNQFQQLKATQEFVNRLTQNVSGNLFEKGVQRAIVVKEKVSLFLETPQGKIVRFLLYIFLVSGIIAVVYKLVKSFGSDKMEEQVAKGARKVRASKKANTDEDSDDHFDPRAWNARLAQLQARYPNHSNEELQAAMAQADEKGMRVETCLLWQKKLNPELQDQSVNNQEPMSRFDNTRLSNNVIYPVVHRNLCHVYMSMTDLGDTTQEDLKAVNYGIFVKSRTLITVAHSFKDHKDWYWYAGCDELGEKKYKIRVTNKFVGTNRDLAMCEIISSKAPQFSDITKHFPSRAEMGRWTTRSFHVQFFRYFGIPEALNKVTVQVQAHVGKMTAHFNTTSVKTSDKVKADYAMAVMEGNHAYTSFGDCGLPYFAISSQFQNKCVGIHCMGSVQGTPSKGMASMVFLEDFEGLKNQSWGDIGVTEDSDTCNICDTNTSVTQDCGHIIIWDSLHTFPKMSWQNHVRSYLRMFNSTHAVVFTYNWGTLWGSVKHQHTKFYADHTRWVDDTKEGVYPAHEVGLDHRTKDEITIVKFKNVSMATLQEFLRNDTIIGFRFDGFVRLRNDNILITTDIYVHYETNFTNQSCEIFSKVNLPSGDSGYLLTELMPVYRGAQLNFLNGKLNDTPFDQIKDNETVKVFGTFNRTFSHVPKSPYFQTPWFDLLKDSDGKPLLPTKLPMENDTTLLTDEQIASLSTDRDGNPSARVTQALQWAHLLHEPDLNFFDEVSQEFMKYVNLTYGKMSLLTDEQVLQGFPKKHPYVDCLGSLQLNASIGWSMKALFNVNKKSDIFTKDEDGLITLNNNDAAKAFWEMFQKAKELVNNGEPVLVTVEECGKMEKLKVSKYHIGRTFCSMDFLNILLERYVMGYFSAKAMRDDEYCAVGVDPYANFHDMFVELRKFDHVFAIDYKRFDKTIPQFLIDLVFDCLIGVNKKMEKPLKSMKKSFRHRIQISGNSLFETLGGMPSGSFITAPLNSVFNLLITFAAFVYILRLHGIDATWEDFQRLVVCRFYGDDGVISVHESIAKFFNRVTLAKAVAHLFGMNMSSANKDEELKPFDTWEEVNFISRYFRFLNGRSVVLGALKKETILSYFHFTKSLEPQHLSSLLEKAAEEASIWGEEFYNYVEDLIRTCIDCCPPLRKHLALRTFNLTILDLEQNVKSLENQEHHELPGGQLYFDLLREYYLPSKQFKALRLALNDQSFFDSTMEFSSVSLLNELFQKGTVSRPKYTVRLAPSGDISWETTLHLTFHEDNSTRSITTVGVGRTKSESKEGASFNALKIIGKVPAVFLNGRKKDSAEISGVNQSDLNVCRFCGNYYDESRYPQGCPCNKENRPNNADYWEDLTIPIRDGERPMTYREIKDFPRLAMEIDYVPTKLTRDEMEYIEDLLDSVAGENQNDIPLSTEGNVPTEARQTEPTVTSGNMLWTNVGGKFGYMMTNSESSALTNPRGTGAPFNYLRSLFEIYRPEIRTTINGSIARGSLLAVLSLNPANYEPYQALWAKLHRYFSPQRCFLVNLAGAAGSIGWVTFSWHPDEEDLRFEDIDEVTSWTTNLNNHQCMEFILDDARIIQQMRPAANPTMNGTEKFPCIAMWVQEPATNVQRNNDVSYPIQIRTKLGPNAVFVTPSRAGIEGGSGGGGIFNSISLSNYIPTNFDTVVGDAGVPQAYSVVSLPDRGYLTGNFDFDSDEGNVVGYRRFNAEGAYRFVKAVHYYGESPDTFWTKPVVDVKIVPETAAFDREEHGLSVSQSPISHIYTAYGEVPTFDYGGVEDPFSLIPGTIYTVPPTDVTFSKGGRAIFGRIIRVMVFEKGIIAEAKIGHLGGVNDITWVPVPSQKTGSVVYYLWDGVVNGVNPVSDLFGKLSGGPSSLAGNGNVVPTGWPTGGETGFQIGDFVRWSVKRHSRILNLTFLQTGNNAATEVLPEGLRAFYFMRPGTSTTFTSGSGFFGPLVPNAWGLLTRLQDIADQLQANVLHFSWVGADGVEIGKLGYSSGFIVCRCSTSRLIRAGWVPNSKFVDIEAATSFSALPTLPTTSYVSWKANTRLGVTRNFFVKPQKPISGINQSAALAIGGGLLSGLGSGLGAVYASKRQSKLNAENWSHLSDLQHSLLGIKNSQELAKMDKQFQQQLELIGKSSYSAMSGNTYGPRGELESGRNFSSSGRLLSGTASSSRGGPLVDLTNNHTTQRVTNDLNDFVGTTNNNNGMVPGEIIANKHFGNLGSVHSRHGSISGFSDTINDDPRFVKALEQQNISKIANPWNYDTRGPFSDFEREIATGTRDVKASHLDWAREANRQGRQTLDPKLQAHHNQIKNNAGLLKATTPPTTVEETAHPDLVPESEA
ncbi:polyprotein [Nylanderia fulva virus 1]|uniref:Polyprotein n=1 Tax=Nylanderia fulva virus 1 TaxID=1871153 RepID=A0A1B2RVR0_9VIRU|nr:polyprotein [Nylanderia fulva virus 1]